MTNDKVKIAIPVFPGAQIVNFQDALSRLGAELVPCDSTPDADDYAGLLLPGGGDADPALYHQPNIACDNVRPELDALQMRTLAVFAQANKPVLGVCRGQQMINVFFGGTLIQHLSCAERHSRMGGPVDKAHMTRTVPGSALEALYGLEFPTNSAHHQAVDQLGEGLEAVQWSDDGVVEGLRHVSLPIIGVQWHPERMCYKNARADTVDGSKIIAYFLNECQRRQ